MNAYHITTFDEGGVRETTTIHAADVFAALSAFREMRGWTTLDCVVKVEKEETE